MKMNWVSKFSETIICSKKVSVLNTKYLTLKAKINW